MHSESVRRVAARFLAANGYFNVGDLVLYGRWKNHRGKVIALSVDHWGNPTVEIEPIPKGRKENKVFGLYKIWRADGKEKALADQAKQATDDFMGDLVYREPENACLTGDPRDCRHDGQGEGRFDERPEGGLPEDALFQKHREPQEEEGAEGLEDEGPPFMRETSLIGATLVSRTSMDPLAERVAQRHLASTIKWKKTPLNSIKGDSGIYARSEPDGRFLVHVHRWRNGQPGDRKYTLLYSAVDYQTPSGSKHYSNIPIPGRSENNSVNVDKVFAAVEKWAHEHPVPAPGLDPK